MDTGNHECLCHPVVQLQSFCSGVWPQGHGLSSQATKSWSPRVNSVQRALSPSHKDTMYFDLVLMLTSGFYGVVLSFLSLPSTPPSSRAFQTLLILSNFKPQLWEQKNMVCALQLACRDVHWWVKKDIDNGWHHWNPGPEYGRPSTQSLSHIQSYHVPFNLVKLT